MVFFDIGARDLLGKRDGDTIHGPRGHISFVETKKLSYKLWTRTYRLFSRGCSPRTSAIDGETLPHFPGMSGSGNRGGTSGGVRPAISQVDAATVTTATIVDVASVGGGGAGEGVGRQVGMPE